jgi:hypothetical protein
MSRIIVIAIAVLVAIPVIGGARWYRYVTNTDTPYDEVGIALNGYMPEAARAWGCAKLHVTFAKSPPPYGCAKAGGSGREWMS